MDRMVVRALERLARFDALSIKSGEFKRSKDIPTILRLNAPVRVSLFALGYTDLNSKIIPH
jgi:hypothetical protein